MQRKTFADAECPIARSLERVGEWWSILIMRDALQGLRRFDEFSRSLDIAPNMLTRRLNALVEAGLLERQPYSQRPLRYQYVPTAKGEDFRVVLMAFVAWGNRHYAEEGQSVQLVERTSGRPVRSFMAALADGRTVPLEHAPCRPGLPPARKCASAWRPCRSGASYRLDERAPWRTPPGRGGGRGVRGSVPCSWPSFAVVVGRNAIVEACAWRWQVRLASRSATPRALGLLECAASFAEVCMRILADENIPVVDAFFADQGSIRRLPGRAIDRAALAEVDVLLVRSVTEVSRARWPARRCASSAPAPSAPTTSTSTTSPRPASPGPARPAATPAGGGLRARLPAGDGRGARRRPGRTHLWGGRRRAGRRAAGGECCAGWAGKCWSAIRRARRASRTANSSRWNGCWPRPT